MLELIELLRLDRVDASARAETPLFRDAECEAITQRRRTKAARRRVCLCVVGWVPPPAHWPMLPSRLALVGGWDGSAAVRDDGRVCRLRVRAALLFLPPFARGAQGPEGLPQYSTLDG